MSAKAFVDSNVLLYLLSADSLKADIATAILQSGATISVQVLNEVANLARRKAGLSWARTNAFLALIRPLCTIEPLTVASHDLGRKIAERYRLSVYDGMIVASARVANCSILYSEDLQDGLRIEQTLVRNPFAA